MASDIPLHGQYFNSEELKKHEYINQINNWSMNQNMQINQNKTKAILISFTNNYKFTSIIQLQGQSIEIIDKIKTLGVKVTNQLDWSTIGSREAHLQKAKTHAKIGKERN